VLGAALVRPEATRDWPISLPVGPPLVTNGGSAHQRCWPRQCSPVRSQCRATGTRVVSTCMVKS